MADRLVSSYSNLHAGDELQAAQPRTRQVGRWLQAPVEELPMDR
jgi:hypothetical protein